MQKSAAGLRRWLPPSIVPGELIQRVGWTTAGHIGTQVIRFATSLVLTRLLAPELFGIMILLMSLRIAMEMFTDIGIGQNVVASRNADDPAFRNTAWTLQVLRGLTLAVAAFFLLPLLSRFYDEAQLAEILPYLSIFFILTGFQSIGLPLAVRSLSTRATALYEVKGATLGAAIIIGFAYLAPNIWGLLVGNLISTLSNTLLSYSLNRGHKHRLFFNRIYVYEIIGLGKWIFLMSVIYFLANNFDRLVLAKYVSFASLGLYGLAQSLGNVFGQFSTKIGAFIIFPSVAAAEVSGSALRDKLRRRRQQFLALTLLPIAGLIATSDLIIEILYDPRYLGAAKVLPWVGLATWVATLSTLNENVLLGLRKPAYLAAANGAKLCFLVVGLPYGVIQYGIIGAAIAALGAETARYVTLSVGQYQQRIGFALQDLAATALLIVLVVVIRSATYVIGLTGSLASLAALSLPSG